MVYEARRGTPLKWGRIVELALEWQTKSQGTNFSIVPIMPSLMGKQLFHRADPMLQWTSF